MACGLAYRRPRPPPPPPAAGGPLTNPPPLGHAVSLKPDLFEGLRFDLTKPLNHNFALSHSIFMGNIDVPTANNQVRACWVRSMPGVLWCQGDNCQCCRGLLAAALQGLRVACSAATAAARRRCRRRAASTCSCTTPSLFTSPPTPAHPSPPPQVVKMPIGTYEFGANLVTNRGNLMLGRITSDGRLTGRVK